VHSSDLSIGFGDSDCRALGLYWLLERFNLLANPTIILNARIARKAAGLMMWPINMISTQKLWNCAQIMYKASEK
jgi:hypothetical protein